MSLPPGTPAYLRIAEDLRAKIKSGAIPAGEQLPSMSQLRELYGVSNTVVRDALHDLRREGLVVGQQGKGVFVRDSTAESPDRDDLAVQIMSRLEDLSAAVQRLDTRVAQLEQDVGQGTAAGGRSSQGEP